MNRKNILSYTVLILLIVISVYGSTILFSNNIDNDRYNNTINNTDKENISYENSITEKEDNKLKGSVLNNTVTIYSNTSNIGRNSQGSGFIYREDYILTNLHVIKNQNVTYIRYNNGDWSKAKVIGKDKYTDIAVLKPDTIPDYDSRLRILNNKPDLGDDVIAVGSPYNFRNSISTGIVSGTSRSMNIETKYPIPDTVQTDAQLNPGNSGGPLILEGTNIVIGVNRAVVGEDIGFAVSSRLANKVASSIIRTGEYNHVKMGVIVKNLNPINSEYNKSVVEITQILNDSNVKSLDPNNNTIIIEKIDNKNISNINDISQYLVLNKDPSDNVRLKLKINNNKIEYVNVSLKKRD